MHEGAFPVALAWLGGGLGISFLIGYPLYRRSGRLGGASVRR